MFDFDPEQILCENDVEVSWWGTIVNNEGTEKKNPYPGWGLSWKHGVIFIGPCSKHKAREAAAIFVRLWLADIPTQMASHLIVAYAFIDSYREAVEMYAGLVNDIERFAREGEDAIRGSMRIEQ